MIKNYTSLLFTMLLAFATTAQVNLQLGLIANYPMDNSTIDVSSNQYDLTASGSPTGTSDRFGNANHAYNLSLSNPDYFTATGASLSAAEVTLAAWVNLTDASQDQKIVGKTEVGAGYLMGVNSNQLDPEFWDSYSNHFRHMAGNVPSNTWTHLVVSFKSNDYTRSYINGVVIDSIATYSFTLGTTFWPLTIGGAPWQATALNVNGESMMFLSTTEQSMMLKCLHFIL